MNKYILFVIFFVVFVIIYFEWSIANSKKVSRARILILRALRSGGMPLNAGMLRDMLEVEGFSLSWSLFDEMMAKLEDHGMVIGWYNDRDLDKVKTEERWYRLPT